MSITSNLHRVWFILTFCSDITVAWIVLKIINALPDSIISADRKQEISTYICCFCAKLIFYLNPQINIRAIGNWNLPDKGPLVILSNHTSPLDAFLLLAMLPLKHAAKMKSLGKAELFQTPILGDILTFCGHFPVHFLRSDLNSFSVDKQKQATVIEDIKKHLNNGGNLVFFPEGQINRSDPNKLQAFRLGLFKIFSELSTVNSLNMYAFLHKGLEKTWHPESNFGGAPAKVSCKVFPLLFSRGAQVQEIQQKVQMNLDSIGSQSVPAQKRQAKL